MSERPPAYFLVLNQNEGEAVVTLAVVNVRKGRVRASLRAFKQSCEQRGLWCTHLHPVAATVLMAKVNVDETIETKGLKGAGAAADAIIGNGPI